ncbi:MAG: MFS transporter [Promethearchaeota archaeon]
MITPGRRLFFLKIEALAEYGTMVFGMAYVGTLMASLGIPLQDFFIVSVINIAITMISQNYFSRMSDKLNNRLPFIIISHVIYAGSMILLGITPAFFSIIIYTVINSFLSSEMLSVAIVYELVDDKQELLPRQDHEKFNKSKEFAKYRIMGSIGWALTAPVAGWTISTLNGNFTGTLAGYKAGFFISGFGTIAITVFLYLILRDYKLKRAIHDNNCNPVEEKEKKPFYLSTAFLMILIPAFIFSLGSSFTNNVLTSFIIEGLGKDEAFYGLLPLAWALSEVPLMFISSAMVKKFSWKLVLVLGFIFSIIKTTAYLFILAPHLAWILIPFQFFNTFGLTYPAYSYALTNEIAPDQKALGLSMRQTMVQAGSFIGSMIGIFISLHLGDGAKTMDGYRFFFTLTAIISCLALGAFLFLNFINNKNAGKSRAMEGKKGGKLKLSHDG